MLMVAKQDICLSCQTWLLNKIYLPKLFALNTIEKDTAWLIVLSVLQKKKVHNN